MEEEKSDRYEKLRDYRETRQFEMKVWNAVTGIYLIMIIVINFIGESLPSDISCIKEMMNGTCETCECLYIWRNFLNLHFALIFASYTWLAFLYCRSLNHYVVRRFLKRCKNWQVVIMYPILIAYFVIICLL